MSLYTFAGERKYLCASERKGFYAALSVLENPEHRTFCETIYWTGCRPSEALALCALNIDMGEGMVVVRSLKKRGRLKGRHFRPVPEIGRAHVLTPVTNAHIVCRHLLAKKKEKHTNTVMSDTRTITAHNTNQ